MTQLCVIYSLADPLSGNVRYVGRTTDVKHRVQVHLIEARAPKSLKGEWLADLLRLELTPVVAVLETTTVEASREAERYWIATFREQGLTLLNRGRGGDGANPGWSHAPEARAKISEALRQRVVTPETKARLSEAKRQQAPETRAKNSAAQTGKKMSPEAVAKAKAALTPEKRLAAAAKAQKSRDERRGWTPEQRREARLAAKAAYNLRMKESRQ